MEAQLAYDGLLYANANGEHSFIFTVGHGIDFWLNQHLNCGG